MQLNTTPELPLGGLDDLVGAKFTRRGADVAAAEDAAQELLLTQLLAGGLVGLQQFFRNPPQYLAASARNALSRQRRLRRRAGVTNLPRNRGVLLESELDE